MILNIYKSLSVPGDEVLSCCVSLGEGWAAELKGDYLTAYKRIPGWTFYLPEGGNLEEAREESCEVAIKTVPYNPRFVFINDWLYRMPIFHPFVPFKQ